MIGLTLNLPVTERVEGTVATTVIGIIKGCEFVRVHDVLENKRACVMTDAYLKRNRVYLMDKIYFKDVEIFANHGVFREEKTLGQKFVFRFRINFESRRSGKNR